MAHLASTLSYRYAPSSPAPFDFVSSQSKEGQLSREAHDEAGRQVIQWGETRIAWTTCFGVHEEIDECSNRLFHYRMPHEMGFVAIRINQQPTMKDFSTYYLVDWESVDKGPKGRRGSTARRGKKAVDCETKSNESVEAVLAGGVLRAMHLRCCAGH